MLDAYETFLVIVIKPCLLGFDVSTYNARVYPSGFTQGQGFTRSQGIYSAHELIHKLIWTEEPFRVVIR
jgi:hypothetical protein